MYVTFFFQVPSKLTRLKPHKVKMSLIHVKPTDESMFSEAKRLVCVRKNTNILKVLNYKPSDVVLHNTHEPTYKSFSFWVEYPFNLTFVCVAHAAC